MPARATDDENTQFHSKRERREGSEAPSGARSAWQCVVYIDVTGIHSRGSDDVHHFECAAVLKQ